MHILLQIKRRMYMEKKNKVILLREEQLDLVLKAIAGKRESIHIRICLWKLRIKMKLHIHFLLL